MKMLACWCCAVMLLLAGCVPERVVWSPDGARAAVLGGDGLHVCDLNGKLSPLLVPHVTAVQWLPDSKRVVVIRQLKDMKEIDELPAETRDSVNSELSDIRRAERSELSHIKPAEKEANDPAAIICLSYELGEKDAKAGPLMVVTMGDGPLCDVRLSPNGDFAVISCIRLGHAPCLVLAKVDSGIDDEIMSLGEAAAYPDWSPDGQYVVYIKPIGEETSDKSGVRGLMKKAIVYRADEGAQRPAKVVTPADQQYAVDNNDGRLGVLVRRKVVDEKGRLLAWKDMPPEEELAATMYDEWSRVRVAKDGRIFFSAYDIVLPATLAEAPSCSLFSFHPGKQATVTRVVPKGKEGELGDMPQLFELSPDGNRISVPSDNGCVMVLDVGTGNEMQVQWLLEPQRAVDTNNADFTDLAATPVWRTATELTFLQPRQDGKGSEIVRYSVTDGTATVISGAWPEAVKAGWLTPKKGAATKPVDGKVRTEPSILDRK